MKIDKEKLFELYMQWVRKISEEKDWRTLFDPKETVHVIAEILENNPNLIKK